jgi:hypothetical protein
LNRHYDLRTKQEAREQRRRELQKHIDGYKDADAADDSMFNEIQSIPTASSITTITSTIKFKNLIRESRKIKGTVGFACYLGLLVADLWLIGIENILNLV